MLERAADEFVHRVVIPETDFSLGRMDIHINLGGMQLEEEKDHAAFARKGISDGTVERRVADWTAIDK